MITFSSTFTDKSYVSKGYGRLRIRHWNAGFVSLRTQMGCKNINATVVMSILIINLAKVLALKGMFGGYVKMKYQVV